VALILPLAWAGDAVALVAEEAGLEAALARYQGIADAGGWPSLGEGPALKPGMVDPGVPVLRARLAATGDLPPGSIGDGESFGTALELAVRRFQERHGLVVDGVVGPVTRAALNVPAPARAATLARNLARLARRPPWPRERFVLVQVPAFAVAAVEDGRPVLVMRAIVGRTTRQTPELRSRIGEIELNPFWTVPPRIARLDIVPKQRRDAGYLAARGIRVFAGWERGAPEVDPDSIDWTAPPPAVKLRQDPGPENALGRVKFLFPNSHHVFLHDTPKRALFERLPRTFSSGCVRIERPFAFAEWLLRDDPAWPPRRIAQVVDSGETKRVRLRAPVPIVLAYFTAWVDGDGRVNFRDDVYERDGAHAEPAGEGCGVDDGAGGS
jgi:murein L,D-transpeptidase YcbB/YkuD